LNEETFVAYLDLDFELRNVFDVVLLVHVVDEGEFRKDDLHSLVVEAGPHVNVPVLKFIKY
jgi:hypothetical protein